MKTLDLRAHRCPTAFIMLRRCVMEFMEDAKPGESFVVQTIEPSIERDLPVFLNSNVPSLHIARTLSGDISQESIALWGNDFDEEEWAGCEQYCFVMTVGK